MAFGNAPQAFQQPGFGGGMGHREFARPHAQPKNPRDKRFAPRRAHKLAAYVSNKNSNGTQHCFVRDSSSTGLLIEMRGVAASANSLPDRLTVYIPIENCEFTCQVVWRAGSRAGLKFVAAARHYHKPAKVLNRASKQPKSILGRLFCRQ